MGWTIDSITRANLNYARQELEAAWRANVGEWEEIYGAGVNGKNQRKKMVFYTIFSTLVEKPQKGFKQWNDTSYSN